MTGINEKHTPPPLLSELSVLVIKTDDSIIRVKPLHDNELY